MTPTDTAPPPPPAQPAPAPGPVRRLTRRADDRVLGGVCSGIADYFAIDPVAVRVLFVLFGIFGGSGVLLYVALWALVPEEHTGEVLARRQAAWVQQTARRPSDRGLAFWLGVALIAIAGATILDHWSFFDGGVIWAFLLMGIGIALFRSSGASDSPDPSSPSMDVGHASTAISDDVLSNDARADDAQPGDAQPRDAQPGDALPDDLTAEAGVPHFAPVAPAPPAPPGGWPPHDQVALGPYTPPPAVRVRERSILGRLTLGLAVLWVGLAAFLNEISSEVDFTAAGVVGVAMAIVGAGLLVGAFVGRARWLILVGILLTPILMAASFADRVDVPFTAGVGERHVGLTDLNPSIDTELFAGELRIDVAEDGLDGSDRNVRARVAAGRVEIMVPAHWTMVVTGEVQAGEIRVQSWEDFSFDVINNGFGAELDQVFPGRAGAPTVTLDLEVVFGQVDIVRHGTDATFESEANGEDLS